MPCAKGQRVELPALATRYVGGVVSVAFSPDGSSWPPPARDGAVWDPITRTRRRLPHRPHRRSCRWRSPDGSLLAPPTAKGRCGVDPITPPDRRSPHRPHRRCRVGDVLPGRKALLATVGSDGTVRLWDPITCTQTGSASGVVSVAFSPDGSLRPPLAATGRCGCGTDHRTQTGDPLIGHTGGVGVGGVLPDGSLLATVGSDGTVRLWDPITRTQTGDSFGRAGRVVPVMFSRTEACWPPLAATGRCGCGTESPAPKGVPPHRSHRRCCVGGVLPGREPAGHCRWSGDGAVVGPDHPHQRVPPLTAIPGVSRRLAFSRTEAYSPPARATGQWDSVRFFQSRSIGWPTIPN